MLNNILQTLYRIISSSKFFFVVIALLLVQAIWFALTVQYPMAFDENYHFGVIQFYSQQLLPFMSVQPPGSEAYGDLVRYDSYMFHYLMSFPYRLIAAFTSDQVVQIIILRFMNIGLFIAGMFVFRRLLKRLNISEALTNFSLLMLILIPIVPFLAATINYDNLAFLIVPLFIALTISCSESIKRGELSANTFILTLAAGVFGSLVKFAFAPIFAIAIIYLLVLLFRSKTKKRIFTNIKHSFNSNSLGIKILLVCVAVLSIGLLAERYGVNLVQYQRFQPSCEKVRPVSECTQYGPWGRDYNTAQKVKITNPPYNPEIFLFLPVWIGNYMSRLYFAINYDYVNYAPLPLPYYTAYAIGLIGMMLSIFYWKTIARVNPHMLLVALIVAVYVGALYYVNFTAFLKLHTIVAANGRYLILVLPFIFVFFGLAYQKLFTKLYNKRAKNMLVALALVVTLFTLNGGGATTHLLRIQPYGYWQNTPAPEINSALKNIVAPTVLGGTSL